MKKKKSALDERLLRKLSRNLLRILKRLNGKGAGEEEGLKGKYLDDRST
jgi:hypothetical protein